MHFGVIEEAPKPSFQPLKERPQELGTRWKKAEALWVRMGRRWCENHRFA